MNVNMPNAQTDQVQAWIASNPQFAQAVVQAMTAPQPAVRYQPVAQNNQNWGGRNSFPTTMTSPPGPVPMNITGIPGRVVASPQEIKPNDIPMDGSAAIFPMADDSCIYAKCWAADGGIQTIRYIPEKVAQAAQNQGPSEFDQVMTRLDKIEQMLGQRYQNKKQYYNNQNTRSAQVNAGDYSNQNVTAEATNNG